MSSELITDAYRALNVELHERIPAYGTGGHKWGDYVRWLAETVGASSVLDYGCGKQSLSKAMPGMVVHGYDPAIHGCEDRVESDIVVCTDVLEHVEIQCMAAVVADIIAHARKAVVLGISCITGDKMLADGRPAHITVYPAAWWAEYLSQFGDFQRIESAADEYNAVLIK